MRADAVFPQFATHNAQTLATIYQMAGPDFRGRRLRVPVPARHGRAAVPEVVGADRLNRPCRIYAPVGTHETLLAYLVRRLLENGANSSFVNRIADPDVSIDELVADPVEIVRAMTAPGAPHDQILLPADLYGARRNSTGIDLSDETALAALSEKLLESTAIDWTAAPADGEGTPRPVTNPADHRDVVGIVTEASPDAARAAATRAKRSSWASTTPADRAACLERAADLMEQRMPILLGLIVREAGKSVPNAIAEVREAVDFLRYYAEQARSTLGHAHAPLGPVTCISPWNFPLAIFTGQIAAALVAGNPVLAKPAEETPLIAAEGVRLLHQAGVPADALQLLPGDGAIGATLVAAPETAAVMFTGSTEVARLIQAQLADRLSPDGQADPADCRDRRTECDDRRFLRARRTGGGRCDRLRVRQRGSALLGAAHPLPAGGDRGSHAGDAQGRAQGTEHRPHRPAARRYRPGDHRRGKRDIETHIAAMRALGRTVEQQRPAA
jgi:RHH-type proline utilization regulon transcriptional repressor/proline dehydrogenase/delta 1-pyrroline-5-carboxylate dehydrogenase